MTEPAMLGTITKEEFQRWCDVEITDKQWIEIAMEIEGRVDNFIDQLIPDLCQDVEEGHFDE